MLQSCHYGHLLGVEVATRWLTAARLRSPATRSLLFAPERSLRPTGIARTAARTQIILSLQEGMEASPRVPADRMGTACNRFLLWQRET